LQYVAEYTEWSSGIRTIDSYIERATKKIRAAATIDREKEIGQAITRLELLFNRNMQITDYKAAAAVQKQRSELLGLNEPQQKHITGDQDVVIKVNMIPKDGSG